MEIDLMVLVPLVAILATVYYYITKNNKYFHDKPIPSLATEPLFGSTRRLMTKKTSFHDFIIEIYNKYPLVKVFGMLDTMQRVFVVRDPELIKRIGVKDFDYFVNHRPVFGNDENPHNKTLFSKTLVALNDQKWRDMRATLSPAFTGSKMRQMFDLIVECSTNMVKYCKAEIHKNGGRPLEYEMKDVFTRFANDVIATCAFGIKVDSLKNTENDFYVNGKKLLAFNRPIAMIKMIGLRFAPKLMSWLNLDLFDRENRDYFTEIIRDTLKTREAHGIVRPDMVNLLMQARKGALKQQREAEDRTEVKGFATVEEADMEQTSKSLQMTELEMVAQCLIFFLAGFDTVSTCLTFLAYELTLNKDVQDKLYEEIRATSKSLEGKSLTYDALQGMQYMDMVVSEALRMWSPAPATDRLCVRDYVVDDGDRLKFTIDKGTAVFIPIAGLHHDPQYYPNPSKFDPERFSEENRDKINPNAYLPFGIGPRNCIGSRFALMEVKAIIYYMLQEFSFEPTPNTQIPLRLEKGIGNICGMHSEKGVFLEFRPRKG
ncbi:probable cytochrome P450 9f2 [Anopheles moucheti]|uniref:probable cytochrome P450 9f2 n=1 Tax=Anopheles moucheti TaxID=186751 RepID=UPI0022EFEA4B|nr:probable cytochrome P450 9f2 [Anopheles moucheti]